MSDGRPPDAASILDRALQLPAAAREAFIVAQCGGDAALLANLRMILAAREAAGAFRPSIAGVAAEDLAMRAQPPETFDAERAAGVPRPSELELGGGDGGGGDGGDFATLLEGPGTRIGLYTLLHQIGEGGFGRVFVAEQHRPVRRQVALKVIRVGMDTCSVVARFEAERQALALMDHPNIAKVLDGGSTASGRPYFVMELVDGVPITRYCDAMKFGIPARLELFRRVCLAVQHAHQKGVIHRDIKPGNVLVAEHDGEAIPKVIDFGIAKATHARLTDRTIVTARETFIGTPQYMSPEQADLASADADIDTRTDIFALGILLYELLTGTTPLESARLNELGVSEMQRLICEAPTPRPSTRVSALGERLPTVAQRRGLPPERLGQHLRGDLDWIVLKATEKERNRRYDSAAAFAADIERHLRNQPVEAGPPTTRYRVQKFVQRNRRAVIAASVLAATLLIGLVGTTTFAVVASQRAAHSLRVEEFLKRLFVATNPTVGDTDQDSTAAILAEAKTLFFGDIGTANQILLAYASRLRVAGQPELAARILEDALDRPDGVRFTSDEAGARMLLGMLYSDLSRHSDAIREADEAVRLVGRGHGLDSWQLGVALRQRGEISRAARNGQAALFDFRDAASILALRGTRDGARESVAALVTAAKLLLFDETVRAAIAVSSRRTLLASFEEEVAKLGTGADGYWIKRALADTMLEQRGLAAKEQLRTRYTELLALSEQAFATAPRSRVENFNRVSLDMRNLDLLAELEAPIAALGPVASSLPPSDPERVLFLKRSNDILHRLADRRMGDEARALRERAVGIQHELHQLWSEAAGERDPRSLQHKLLWAGELHYQLQRPAGAVAAIEEVLATLGADPSPDLAALRLDAVDRRAELLDELSRSDPALVVPALAARCELIDAARSDGTRSADDSESVYFYAELCVRNDLLAAARAELVEEMARGCVDDAVPSASAARCLESLLKIDAMRIPSPAEQGDSVRAVLCLERAARSAPAKSPADLGTELGRLAEHLMAIGATDEALRLALDAMLLLGSDPIAAPERRWAALTRLAKAADLQRP